MNAIEGVIKIEEDLFEKVLEQHKGLYIFNPEFWKNLHNLRKQLNYQTAILKEIPYSNQLSEEEEVELIKKLVKEAQEKRKITSEVNPEVERFKEYLLSKQENIRRKKGPK